MIPQCGMTITVPAPMPRFAILIKAVGDFKHSGKYYLQNGRWHALHQGKPAPKGAPVAAHKHAAGQFVPKQHFTDEEWQKLELPAENSNAGTFNKQLAQLKQMSDTGDVTGILGMSAGTNTYGKKLATIANHLLGLYRTEHQVTPGQKAGEHPAVQQAPAEASATVPVEQPKPKLGPVGQVQEAVAAPEAEPTAKESLVVAETASEAPAYGKGDKFKFSTGLAKVNSGTWEIYNTSGDLLHMKKVGAKVPNSSNTVNIPKDTLDQALAAGTAAKVGNDGALESKLKTTDDYLPSKKSDPAPASAGLTIPSFVEGKTTQGVVDYYAKQAQKILDLAAAGDSAGLEKLKADGLKPNSKGKVGNTWAGKTGNSKMLLALHEQALAQVKGESVHPAPSAAEPHQLQYQKLVDGLVAKDDWSTLQGLKDDGAAPWAAKILDEALAKKPAPTADAAPAAPAAEASKPSADQYSESKGDGSPKLTPKGLLMGAGGHAKTFANKTQAQNAADKLTKQGHQAHVIGLHPFFVKVEQAAAEPSPAEKVKQATQAATAAVAQTPEHKEAISIATEKVGAGSKLSQIPWDSQLLPDSNKNAKSHNKQVAKIQAMAEAGDLAGLEAFKAGKNTYGTKQNKLAALAIAALKEDAAAPAASPIEEQSAKHVAEAMQGVKNAWKGMVESGNAQTVKQAVASYEDSNSDGDWDELISYGKQLLASAAPAEAGPQEGDTKPGADGGTLVFSKGRWHKQEQPQAAEPAPEPSTAQHPIDAVPMPELNFSNASNNQKVAVALEKLKAQIKEQGPAALKGATKHMKAKGKYIVSLPGGYSPLKVYGYEHAPDHVGTKIYNYVEALKAATGKPPKKAATKKAAAPVIGANGIQSMDSWKQTGPQGGSNPGGKFKDENGVEWYCKFPGDEDVAKSEVLAAQLYAIAGIAGQDAKLVTKDGKLGIASKWTTVSKASPADLAKTQGALAGFGVDAWLANWDVVGLGYDNLQVNEQGKAVRVDAGGSLTYRAQGGKKAFGTTVSELDSLRDAKINPQAAAVFGKMTQADITAAVAKVLAIPDAAIINAVEIHGPGDAANKKALADVLIARKADLAAKFPKAVKPPKKRLDPNSLPVDPDRLPKAHDFNNWLGAGKPLSSQPHVNAANMAVEQEILALAKTGNLTKLKEFKFHAIDKATGNATGQMIPIADHPSKHVVQLHADLVIALDEIANPPEPLKVFQETDVGTIEQLSASLPPKKFGTTVGAVKSNEKLGFWVVLGTAHGAAKFKPQKVMDYSHAAIAAAKQKFQQASHLAKHFIHSVQASGSYNDLFRNGKTHDGAGNKLSDVAQAALEHATTMPEGTSLYRWQSMPDEMVKKIIDAPDGTVFQATGPMCTSYHPTGTAGFGKHRVTVRYAKGAKAVESFGSGKFSGEKEVTTLPNSRFVILKKEMVPDVEHGNPGGKRLELEVLMLPPDLGL